MEALEEKVLELGKENNVFNRNADEHDWDFKAILCILKEIDPEELREWQT